MLYSTQGLKMLSEKEAQSGSRVCTRSTTKNQFVTVLFDKSWHYMPYYFWFLHF